MGSSGNDAPSSNPFANVKDSIVLWWDAWTDWISIGAVWVLAWLTIILGPPATFGLYYTASELREGRAIGVRGFVQAGKENFLRSWLWMLVFMIVAIVIATNYTFYGGIDQDWATIIQGVMIVVGVLWITIQFYTLPFLMLQTEQSLRLAWKNAFLTAVASPLHTLVTLVISVLFIVPSLLFFIPLFLGAQGLVAVLGIMMVENRLRIFGILKIEE
jgi:uncharacterized membrane protein YesL